MRQKFADGFGSNAGDKAGEGRLSNSEEALVKRFRGVLLDEVDLAELGGLDVHTRRLRLENVLSHLITREGVVLATRERTTVVRRVVDEVTGLGVLEPLLNDPSISEIMINGYDTVYVERKGRLQRIQSGFTSEEQLVQVIDRIVSTVNRRVDESSPMVDARLPADARMPRGARVNVILPPLALTGPTMTIRLFPESLSMGKMIELGSLDQPTADLLACMVRARFNIMVSGGTGTGKTTLLNALSQFIPGQERIVTIEDAAELSLMQEHVIRLESRPANTEGKGQIVIRDLVRNALRMRPDRIIVGEVRGGEALDMLQAMNTGHEGSLATVHANGSLEALGRLETLATMSDVEVPFSAIRDQVNGAIHAVVQLKRGSDGTRRVVDVSCVTSKARQEYEMVSVAGYREFPDHPELNGFEHKPLPQVVADILRVRRETPPAEFAGAGDLTGTESSGSAGCGDERGGAAGGAL